MNTCFFCKGSMELTRTKFVVDLGSFVLIVKNVPAWVCRQCGEKVFDDDVMEKLEKIVQTVKGSLVQEVAIVDFADRAA